MSDVTPDECPECGYEQPDDPEMRMAVCPRCSRDHELYHKLRELVEEWREEARYKGTVRDSTTLKRANELEALIDD